ncbi:MAG: site-2 protease family protein [Thermoleophilia bacterium]|nr:site-2 protease family protein [Thermoleophilia bacterium]
MPYALVILSLIVLVVLHELGHFLAARAVGIRATKFYVFFPPAIFKRKIGEVEYGIGAIPAGGFVKLPGMFRPEAGDVSERLRWEFEEVLPMVDSAGRLQLDAARRGVAHADSTDDMVPPLREVRDVLARTIAERETTTADVDLKRVRSALDRIDALLDDLHPRAYWRAALWRRMTVIFAGPFVNLLIAFVVLSVFFWTLQPKYEVTGALAVASVAKDSPAAQAGLDTESRIVEWNGPVKGISPNDLGQRIADSLGEPTDIAWIDADGDRHAETIVPTEYAKDVKEPRLGLAPQLDDASVSVVGRVHEDPVTGMTTALDRMWTITSDTFTRLPRVFFDANVRQDVGSVVGIVDVADDVDRSGWLIGYVALISLILAVMNLLPLLPLDGGHLLFGLLEAIRRRPMPRAAFERYSMVGLALVLILFFIGLDNDITRARG